MVASSEHAALVQRASKWLLRVGMGRVVAECCPHWTVEHPDSIGWNMYGWSILVECKVSRADFLADVLKRKKWAENGYCGMGHERYYLTPQGLLSPSDIPEGWGLLEAGKRIRRVVKIPGMWEEQENGIKIRKKPNPEIQEHEWRIAYSVLWNSDRCITAET